MNNENNNIGELMEIRVIGTDRRLPYAVEYIESCMSHIRDGVTLPTGIQLLPIPTRTEEGIFRGSDIRASDFISSLRAGELIVGYGIGEELRRECICRGAATLDLAEDDIYIREGAELTALAAVSYIMERLSTAPTELTVGVIGYGRIGSGLCRFLSALEARVNIISGRAEEAFGAENKKSLYGIYSYESIGCAIEGISVLINTAPEMKLSRELAGALSGVLVIELAGGDNIPPEIPHICLPALPGVKFPATAGHAVGRAVMRFIG